MPSPVLYLEKTDVAYTMKVLMFGWEFPPHISGGLGTACEGLTRALEQERVKILFTVPKLHGGERAVRTTFINASTVPVPQQPAQESETQSRADLSKKQQQIKTAQESRELTVGRTQRTLIEVPSFLAAYPAPGTIESPVQQWNYSFKMEPENIGQRIPGVIPVRGERSNKRNTVLYDFSGTYGANLLQEVERYAAVGAEIARLHRFDVIHAHDWMTYPAGLAAKRVSGKPLIVHVHATEIDRSGMNVNTAVFAIEKEGMTKADKVVAVSHRTKNIAVEHYGIDAAKIEVVHNGVTPREKVPAGSAPPIGAPIVTFLGRITHQKGPLYFVEAARRVHKQLPDVHFVVAGSGDQLPQMIDRIAQLRLSRHFHFTGFLRGADIDRVWSMSSVYVMPSVSEPFGIAPLEAIQAGVPVIVSKQAGVSEVMNHAIKVDFWDCDALADSICNVLRFKSLANTLRDNCANEVKMLTWNKAAKKLTTLYYELSQKPKRRKKHHLLLSGSSTPPPSRAAVL